MVNNAEQRRLKSDILIAARSRHDAQALFSSERDFPGEENVRVVMGTLHNLECAAALFRCQSAKDNRSLNGGTVQNHLWNHDYSINETLRRYLAEIPRGNEMNKQ